MTILTHHQIRTMLSNPATVAGLTPSDEDRAGMAELGVTPFIDQLRGALVTGLGLDTSAEDVHFAAVLAIKRSERDQAEADLQTYLDGLGVVLLEGWGTANRTLLLHLVLAIDGQTAKDRVDRVASNPELLRARVDMLAYLKRGRTSATNGTEHIRTREVQQPGPFVMLSVKAASVALEISESLVCRYCRDGSLIAIKVNGAWQVEKEAVEIRRRQKERQI